MVDTFIRERIPPIRMVLPSAPAKIGPPVDGPVTGVHQPSTLRPLSVRPRPCWSAMSPASDVPVSGMSGRFEFR
jgi:hypothetical protein